MSDKWWGSVLALAGILLFGSMAWLADRVQRDNRDLEARVEALEVELAVTRSELGSAETQNRALRADIKVIRDNPGEVLRLQGLLQECRGDPK